MYINTALRKDPISFSHVSAGLPESSVMQDWETPESISLQLLPEIRLKARESQLLQCSFIDPDRKPISGVQWGIHQPLGEVRERYFRNFDIPVPDPVALRFMRDEETPVGVGLHGLPTVYLAKRGTSSWATGEKLVVSRSLCFAEFYPGPLRCTRTSLTLELLTRITVL